MTNWSVDRLRSYLAVSAQRIPNVAASIAWRRGRECWSGTLRCGSRQLSTDSRFPIWSITKTVTAVVILRLVAAGRIGLDSNIAVWLSTIPHAGAISIRHCLQHTSGWSDYGPLPEYQAAVRRSDPPWSFSQFLEQAHAETLLFKPGTSWAYSNIGYMVLRKVIEHVCNARFAEIVNDEVCDPLGLIHTSAIETRSDFLGLTVGYSLGLSHDGDAVDVRSLYDLGWAPTGVAASTAAEVVRFYDGLFSGQLLPVQLLREMCAVIPVGRSHPTFVTPSYGLGLMADPDNRLGSVYGHNGEGPGYAASAFHFRPAGGQPVTVAVLTNTENYQEAEMMALKVGEELTSDQSYGTGLHQE